MTARDDRPARCAQVLTLLALLLVPCAGRPALALDLLGTEFQVNTYTTGRQGHGAVAVAADPAGNFVVVWDSYPIGDYIDDVSVFGQRYDANGVPQGSEFQVNSYTTGVQGYGSLAVAMDPTGGFVVVWGGEGDVDDEYENVFGRRFDSAGAPLGGDFQVNSYTTGYQGDYRAGVGVAFDPTGNFVVVWGGEGQDDYNGVFARRFDSTGTPLGGDFQVNTYTTGRQGRDVAPPAVAADAAGNFVVVWGGEGQGDDEGVFAQRFNAAGNPVGTEFMVNLSTTPDQADRSVAVAADPAGNFVVAWNSHTYVGTADSDVFARRLDASGNPQGGEFQVNTYTTFDQGYGTHRTAAYGGIAIAADPSGGFLVVWDSDADQDGNGWAVIGRHFDSGGNPTGGESVVNTYTTGAQFIAAATAAGAGHFVVAWTSNEQIDDYSDVFAQRFEVPAVPPNLILGLQMIIRDRTGLEARRSLAVRAKEKQSDIAAIDGNPVTDGATLRIVVSGTTDSDQTYVLDGAGWRALRDGFRYTGPTGADGDPVKRVSIQRSTSGEVLFKADLKGSLGTQDLAVVPPNTGDGGGAILTINGGGTYCVAFGGAAGGVEVRDDAQLWKIKKPTAQPGCPAP